MMRPRRAARVLHGSPVLAAGLVSVLLAVAGCPGASQTPSGDAGSDLDGAPFDLEVAVDARPDLDHAVPLADGDAVGNDLPQAIDLGPLDVGPVDLPPADTTPPSVPGGKANYVVATGVFVVGPRNNRVRLGTYVFDGASGTVAARTYLWTQDSPAPRVGSGVTPAGGCSGTASTVPACEVLVPEGYPGAPTETRSGTFTLLVAQGKPYVSISWPAAVGKTWTEQWWVEPSSDGKYAVLTFKYSNGATHGFGYGSNAALSTRRPLVTVKATKATLKYQARGWAHDQLSTPSMQPWDMSLYTHCSTTTHCMTYHQPSSATSCKSGCVAPYDQTTAIEYYVAKISSYDRRDTFWHWCRCLAKGGACYFGNSHVKPMLQIIDDNGGWRGWVGVEASFYPYASSDPREADMLSVWRVFEG